MSKEHMEKMVLLRRLLHSHDWFYAYSDDHNVWRQGESNSRKIQELVSECGIDGARLYSAYIDINFYPGSGHQYQYENCRYEYSADGTNWHETATERDQFQRVCKPLSRAPYSHEGANHEPQSA